MAEASEIKCPHCGQSYFVQPEQWAQYLGQTINCTRCGREFQVTSVASSAPTMPQIPQRASPATMTPARVASANVGPTSPFQQQPPGGYPGALVPTSGWAIASLIVGIFGFCVPFICGIFAVIAGFIGLSHTNQGRAKGRGLAIAGIIVGFISLLLNVLMIIGMFLPAIGQARGAANQVKCANNMRQLGLALIMHANAHQDSFPNQLADLANDPSPPDAQTFVCPDDTRTPPSSASTQQMITDLNSGNHCSYIYAGHGLNIKSGANTVLMYEAFELQRRGDVNVLFVDGSVEKIPADYVQGAVKDAKGNGPILLAKDRYSGQ